MVTEWTMKYSTRRLSHSYTTIRAYVGGKREKRLHTGMMVCYNEYIKYASYSKMLGYGMSD